MDNKRIVIYGGGTVSYIRNHLALCAPAYGGTARRLAELAPEYLPNMDVDVRLTKMAGGKSLETNEDISRDIDELVQDDTTKIVIMSAALCDFNAKIGETPSGKYAARLKSRQLNLDDSFWDTSVDDFKPRLSIRGVNGLKKNGILTLRDVVNAKDFEYMKGVGEINIPKILLLQRELKKNISIDLTIANKIIRKVREKRKDIFLVGFKTTTNAGPDEQYLEALNLCKKASCNLVVANDTVTRFNMIVTPEESRYAEGTNRDWTLRELLKMAFNRTHLTFTRSTVVDGKPVPWESEQVPPSLRKVVNYCIKQNAYKPFNGVTAGHFACKINHTTFLTSIRKTDFNDLSQNGLVKIVTDGPDTVLAYGAKPSVGGQSQRIVFHDHPDVDCIVHFHCPMKTTSKVPSVSQKEFECGSHECGHNTSKGLTKFGNLYAVYLDNHGPNIVFDRSIDPDEVIRFIEENFDLSEKTGGFVSIKERLATPDALDDLVRYTT